MYVCVYMCSVCMCNVYVCVCSAWLPYHTLHITQTLALSLYTTHTIHKAHLALAVFPSLIKQCPIPIRTAPIE